MAKNTYQSRLDVSTSKDSCSDVLDLFERKDFKKALKICEARLKEDKNIYTLLNLKALIFSELGEYEKAVKIFDEALSITDLDEIKVNKAKTLYAWAKRLYFPDYNYLFNILFNLGIYPNVERFDLNNYREYESIEEAMDNGKFRLDLYSNEEKELLKEYLERILTKDEETGKYYNVKDKADWVLIWWKK